MRRIGPANARKIAMGVFVGFSTLLLLAATVSAEVPAAVDSYGGNAFSSGIHVIAGSNNDPNFSSGAIGNRYPLAQAGQDISPASSATASLNDYGPLVSTVLGTDCNAPPPNPIPPPPGPQKPPNYCLEPARAALPYARAQFPNPPGKPHDSVNGPLLDPIVPGGPAVDLGTATADASELAARADGQFVGGSPVPNAAITNATAQSETTVAEDGTITVRTHSHLGSACFGACGVSNWLMVTNTDVQTIVTAVAGKPVPDAIVAPGHVEFCTAPGSCVAVQVDSNGVTLGQTVAPLPSPPPPPPGVPVTLPTQPSGVPVPGLGASAQTTIFKVRTINPLKTINGSTGSVDAFGLDVEVMQPGNQDAGVPDAQVEFILGEGHVDGFSLASQGIGADLGGGGELGGNVTGILGDIVGGNPGGSSTAVALPAVKHTVIHPGTIGLAGAIRPPFVIWFYGWEASALAAAAAMVWARRSRLRELAEEAMS